MRAVLRLPGYAAAMAALWWLRPQIAASFQRAIDAGSAADAARGYALFSIYLMLGAALGLFAAWDVSRFLGGLAGRLFWGGGRVPAATPALWKAERLRRQGHPQEAITALRKHLETRPRSWAAPLRIAEIYQHDLKDPLLATLEYEELLQRRLPRSLRAEIMLRSASCCLLLRDGDRSAAMLRRLIKEFPTTPAAEKAARRLARMSCPPGR